jgi:hypothetical protein
MGVDTKIDKAVIEENLSHESYVKANTGPFTFDGTTFSYTPPIPTGKSYAVPVKFSMTSNDAFLFGQREIATLAGLMAKPGQIVGPTDEIATLAVRMSIICGRLGIPQPIKKVGSVGYYFDTHATEVPRSGANHQPRFNGLTHG